ncbi:hypothetical protein [Caulobacter soli]|uniref:hypothetical protein n=1 Tax=Caulobacter soli TaxID=2708539 RepID=UPI0013EA8732|nr:hypothetical protein [Caulobacter soli]
MRPIVVAAIASTAGAILVFCANAAVAQCASAAPDRCTAQQCAQRHQSQVTACGSISGPPYAYMCTRVTRDRDKADFVTKNLRCLQARRSTSECFAQIDAGHRHQITTLKNAVTSCGGTVPVNPFNPNRP